MALEYFKDKVDMNGIDMPWESAFPKTTGFECARCGFCCMGRVGLTGNDVREFDHRGLEDLIDYGQMPSPWTPFERILKKKPDRSCINLSDRSLCLIYKDRPMVCRCFPFLLSAGYENDLIMDVMLRCPFVDISQKNRLGSSLIPMSMLNSIASEYANSTLSLLRNTIQYQTTLVKHIQATMPAAFFPRQRKLEFMDKAIDLLRLENPLDLVGTAKNWSAAISQEVHSIIKCDLVEYSQMPHDSEILGYVSYLPGTEGIDKKRWKNILPQLANPFLYPGKKGNVSSAIVSTDFFGVNVKSNDASARTVKKIPFKAMSALQYEQPAVDLIKDYMRLIVRRSSFQYLIARSADFLADYARVGIVDFELEATMLSNGMVAGIDPLAKTIAALGERDSIGETDLRYAISNLEGGFISSLVNDTLANQLVSSVMSGFNIRKPKQGFLNRRR